VTAEATDRLLVGCTANATFVVPLAAMVESLMANLADDRAVDLVVVDAGIGEDDRRRLLSSWDGERLSVRWVRVEEGLLVDLPLWGRMCVETYHRLLMTELFPPAAAKAIWLDCDLIVLGDVAELWDLEMGDLGLLAAQDLVVPYVSSPCGIDRYSELGLAEKDRYFNAGIMVVNLEWWRRHDVTGRALAYMRQHRDRAFFWDQEGLNVALAGHWDELDPRWNQIASVAGRSFHRAEHLAPDMLRGVVEDPLIVHFAGALKPWLRTGSTPAGELFFSYLDRTAWAGWRPRVTPASFLRGLYESRLRPVLYRLERPLLKLVSRRRRWS